MNGSERFGVEEKGIGKFVIFERDYDEYNEPTEFFIVEMSRRDAQELAINLLSATGCEPTKIEDHLRIHAARKRADGAETMAEQIEELAHSLHTDTDHPDP